MGTSFVKEHHDYLDSLIANYPMNDYERVRRLTKQEKRQRTMRKFKDAVAYTICSIVVIGGLLFMACVDSIVAGM